MVRIDLMKNQQSSRTHVPGKMPQHLRRLRLIHHDKPPYDCIEGAFEFDRPRVTDDEAHLFGSLSTRARVGRSYSFFRSIDAKDAAARPHESSCQQRNVAGAAADVENVHALASTGFAQNERKKLSKETGL